MHGTLDECVRSLLWMCAHLLLVKDNSWPTTNSYLSQKVGKNPWWSQGVFRSTMWALVTVFNEAQDKWGEMGIFTIISIPVWTGFDCSEVTSFAASFLMGLWEEKHKYSVEITKYVWKFHMMQILSKQLHRHKQENVSIMKWKYYCSHATKRGKETLMTLLMTLAYVF